MEDTDGNLLVLDHPYCNEYYEYALKQRILENMLFAGENVANQLGMIEGRLRGARNNALSFVNTPNFKELYDMWWANRKAQYHNYYKLCLRVIQYIHLINSLKWPRKKRFQEYLV